MASALSIAKKLPVIGGAVSAAEAGFKEGQKLLAKPGSVQAPSNNKTSSTSAVSTPLPSLLGLKATAPTTKVSTPTLPSGQQQPRVSPPTPSSTSGGTQATGSSGQGVDTNLQLRPGEAINDYNIRINNYQDANRAATKAANAPTPAPKQPQEQKAPKGYDQANTGLYGQLITDLANRSSKPSQAYTEATDYARKANDALLQSRTNQNETIAANFLNPIPLQFQQGRGQVLTNQYLQQQAALGSAFQGATNLQGAANTQQGLQQQGLQAAAGLAAPQQVSYSNQYLNPLTGESVGGGGASGSLQSAVANVAEKVKSGLMGYNDGIGALGAYGQGGVNALQQALGADFDIVGSNARAAARSTDIGQTGSIGGQVAKAANSALPALDALQGAYNALPSLGRTELPFINGLIQNLSTQLGPARKQTSAFIAALQEARAQVSQVLAPAIGVDAANSNALALLPDNMIPAEVPQKIAAVKKYIQQRVSALTQPGTAFGGDDAALFDW